MATASSSSSARKIKLISSDNKELEADESMGNVSDVVKKSLQAGHDSITLNNVPSHVLELVIEYCKRNEDNERRKNWIPNLVNFETETLADIFNAACYLDKKDLMHISYKILESRGEVTEDMRDIYPKNDILEDELVAQLSDMNL